ncbi:MAG: protein-glutamate methylesterase/protein-glutamine glutaminase [Thermoguttaceae bacterium]
MGPAKIRVLVVDDSAVLRKLLCDHVAGDAGMEVVGTAGNGRQALEMIDSLHPDVVTLDIQMPVMDGLETLDALLARRPVPVIMVSSLSQRGADITLEALDRGALDYLPKPGGTEPAEAFQAELSRKIRAAAGADVRRILDIRRKQKTRRAALPRTPAPATPVPAAMADSRLAAACIVIGISTGGPPALGSLLASLAPPMPPIVVVQHMPPNFTKPLAWRLNSLSPLTVTEAQHADALQPNHVLIAPGGKHLQLRRWDRAVRAVVGDGEPVSGHKPSIDVLMQSAAEVFAAGLLGVIMTGMGYDGVAGCAAIRAAGGYVLGQDQASSDVYGMNKAAYVQGHVDQQFALDDAAETLRRQATRGWHPAARAAASPA